MTLTFGFWLQFVWWLLALCLKGVHSNSTFSKIACHGDVITLRCQTGETIQITDAIYQTIQKDTPFCRHTNRTTASCQGRPLRERVSDLCAGKLECKLTQNIENVVNNECGPSMYLQVSYNCLKDVKSVPAKMITTRKPVTTLPSSKASKSGQDISIYFRLILLFMEMRTVPGFVAASPRKAALCLILSLAFGISLVIIYMLIVACCHRFGRKKQSDSVSDVARDDEDGGVKAMLISPPTNLNPEIQNSTQPVHYETVLVTRQNGVPLHETTISSDSTLLARKSKKNQGHAEVISTIKRTHSVDEGTQTDNEDTEDTQSRQPRTLSIQEAQELGDLVDVLNYYNSRIDDDDAFYPQFNGNHFQSKTKSHKLYEPETQRNHSDYYYANRGPPFDDEGRSSSNTSSSVVEKQPLLTNDTRIPPRQPSPYYASRYGRLSSERKNLSRNPSEISYTTSVSNTSDASLREYSPEAIFNGDNLRMNSLQLSPKPGVRGDGFEFIVNSSGGRP